MSLVLRGNKQTNKKRFPGEKVGKREARPGKRGRGEAREYRGGGGGGGAKWVCVPSHGTHGSLSSPS